VYIHVLKHVYIQQLNSLSSFIYPTPSLPMLPFCK